MKTILLAPAYNEEGKIGEVVRRAKPFVDKVLVVDDASIDNTFKEAEKNGATVIKHSKNRGVGAAIRTGINYATKKGYGIIIIIAGDNQDNPEEIPRLLKKIENGYDFVQGSRYLSKGNIVNHPFYRKILTRLHPKILGLSLGKLNLTDSTNGFRAFRTHILKDKRINLNQKWLDRYELEVYLYYKVNEIGYKVTEVPVTKTYHLTKSNTKMVPIIDWWKMLKPILMLKFGLKR